METIINRDLSGVMDYFSFFPVLTHITSEFARRRRSRSSSSSSSLIHLVPSLSQPLRARAQSPTCLRARRPPMRSQLVLEAPSEKVSRKKGFSKIETFDMNMNDIGIAMAVTAPGERDR